MKRKIPYILIALLVAIQINSIIKINNLENQIRDVNNRINMVENNLMSSVNAIYSNVDDMLEEQTSIINNASISFGEFDNDTLTVPIIFSVQPKTVTSSMNVLLKFDDESILLSKDDIVYSGTKLFALTDDEIFPTIVIEDDGIQSITQDYGLRINSLIDEFIPRLYPMSLFNYSVGSKPNSEIIEYYQKPELLIEGNYENFKKVEYVTYIDGEKVNEVDIDLSKINMGEPISLPEKIYELTNEQILTTYVVALDNIGFNHQYPLEYYEAGSDEFREPYFGIVRVTGLNGEIIYDTFTKYAEKYQEEYGQQMEVVYP